ncbi:hypothetical protein J2Z79_002968 [Symbiobacterium terraclitae]|jgi:hypothetical protein|uniref:Uncharacterized protein n=1 Tax=Symbiobacterium terraclitae TaxID=557451 RepID=A0ABS4JVH5_9FIRM|nr:hypothetical protein [Symbiobacterium terraclitae]MBP2019526.1 hypothetical protein [Symbiobacterium terraclitae]
MHSEERVRASFARQGEAGGKLVVTMSAAAMTLQGRPGVPPG